MNSRMSVLSLLLLAACGGEVIPAPAAHAPAEDAAETADAPAATGLPAIVRGAPASPSDAGASDAGDAGNGWGPTCMFNVAGCGGAVPYACGPSWCCDAPEACDSPKASLCSEGPCGAGNTNTTCAQAGGEILCCAVSPGCPR